MKKIVLKVDLHDDKAKQKALRVVSSLPGIDAISMDMKERKLTVIGTADPVGITSKLRKYWPTAAIILVGPAKEPEKKEEPKKDEGGGGKKDEEKKEEEKKDGGGGEGKKEEGKKDEGKKEEGAKKDDGKGDDAKKPAPAPVLALPQPILHHPHHIDPRFYHHYEMMRPYRPYPPPPMTAYYHAAPSMEDNPNALCTIS